MLRQGAGIEVGGAVDLLRVWSSSIRQAARSASPVRFARCNGSRVVYRLDCRGVSKLHLKHTGMAVAIDETLSSTRRCWDSELLHVQMRWTGICRRCQTEHHYPAHSSV